MPRGQQAADLFAPPGEDTPSSARGDKPVKRSLTIAGHRTSISLEEAFWDALREVSRAQGKTVAGLIFLIDAQRGGTNLSSAIRVFLLNHFRKN